MWVTAAFLSALLLGFYDVAKKQSLKGNAVIPVLLLNTLFATLLFTPVILNAELGLGWFDDTLLNSTSYGIKEHALVATKAMITLSSWEVHILVPERLQKQQSKLSVHISDMSVLAI